MYRLFSLGWCVLAAALGACRASDGAEAWAPAGDPLPGLDENSLTRFRQGQALFNRAFTPDEGLGPLFNQDRCSSCHDIPISGGTGTEVATKATRSQAGQGCDLLVSEGGATIQQRATPLLVVQGVTHELTPRSATSVSRITPPALFGLGLMEAIPDEELLRRADPDDEDRDGISGRVGRTPDLLVARFGRKAEFATIRDFVDGALRFEMGLTTPQHSEEETINGATVPRDADPASDPEISDQWLDLLTDYVRFLAPPLPPNPPSDVARDTLIRGERLFRDLGCHSCHEPTMVTGRHPNGALDRKTIRLYSDLLLHDLGPAMESTCAVGVAPSEHRTAPLMGLRYRTSYMHDGRAGTVWGAITLHGGEAAAITRQFESLGSDNVDAVIRFLYSL